MNDLDLRSALHRDAQLVGAPSPDLLDQLLQRRQHQRRQRAGVFAAALGVVVIAAGIPVGTSLLAQSDRAPAAETTVDPTPSAVPEATRVPTATVAPTTVGGPAVTVPLDTSPPPAADLAPACPDLATLDAALPQDTATDEFTIFPDGGEVCADGWVAAGFTWSHSYDGDWVPDGEAGLFHYVDGSWTFSFRDAHCGDPAALPAVVWERACTVD